MINYYDPENQKLSLNQMVSIDACMVQAGFHDRYDDPYWCYNYKNLPICRLGVMISQRSVKKRLNSPFCKQNKNGSKCQPLIFVGDNQLSYISYFCLEW
ncbi:hypothetical protein [Bartonella harrusi]|uniref:hypothetical protein n=1 Tax=Bartonella harrusi TaxID=2961895 RepID=UPI0035A8F2B9